MYKKRTKRLVVFDARWNVETKKCLQGFSLYRFRFSILILRWIQLYIEFHLKMRFLFRYILILCIKKICLIIWFYCTCNLVHNEE
jgi:hypothetical protein